MRTDEEYSLLDVRIALETLCIKNVIRNATDEELDRLQPILDTLARAVQPQDAAEATYHFHHELAVISGNMLLPLLYHSFKAASICLWTRFCREQSCTKLYEIKLQLYRALLNRDTKEALRLTPGEF